MSHKKSGSPKQRSANLIGSRLREARSSFSGGLTQDQLSGRLAALGVQLDRPVIAKIESGKRRVCDYEVVALAQALKVEVTWLLGVGHQPGKI